jgi:class 3 adenylate cyclase
MMGAVRMTCLRCEAVSREGARFCESCGVALRVACSHCGAIMSAGARFCRQCGGAMSGSGAPEGERKQVTTLVCALAGAAEPGGAARLLDAALAEIRRFEGTIDVRFDDGFLALFGAPIAREDHARRAALAALGLQRAARELGGPAPRVGINTGPVVVGEGRSVDTAGDTGHVARRLAEAAAEGDIVVSETTARLAEGYVRLEPSPRPGVEGAASAAGRRVLGPGPRRSRLDEAEGRGLTPLVGREDELAHLTALLARAESGRGQVLGVVGEAGVGKSRLIREFRRRIAARPVSWLEGRCVPYGGAMAYLPVLEILRQHCALADDDHPEAVATKVRASLREAGLDAAAVPYLLHVLGLKEGAAALVADPPEAVKARTFELLRQMMLGGSRRRPLVMVIEDLHWVDTTSEHYAASLVERVAGAPIFLVFTYRAGYRPRWGDRSSGTQLALTALGATDSRRLVDGAAAGTALTAGTVESILEKAEGNPLFLEELTRAAAAGAASGAVVPDTVLDVLSARVDHLPEMARRLLQCAAVLGRQFSLRLLRTVWDEAAGLEDALRELGRLEILEERVGADEPTFAFKHALMREVIEGSLLEPRRRAVEARLAGAREAPTARA